MQPPHSLLNLSRNMEIRQHAPELENTSGQGLTSISTAHNHKVKEDIGSRSFLLNSLFSYKEATQNPREQRVVTFPCSASKYLHLDYIVKVPTEKLRLSCLNKIFEPLN